MHGEGGWWSIGSDWDKKEQKKDFQKMPTVRSLNVRSVLVSACRFVPSPRNAGIGPGSLRYLEDHVISVNLHSVRTTGLP
jgi:hypothetical protein